MATDYFSGDEGDVQERPGMGGEDQPAKGAETEEKDDTALLPKSLLGGKDFAVREEVVLKIVADHGEEIEVAYATEKGEEHEEGNSMMNQARGKLEAMGGEA